MSRKLLNKAISALLVLAICSTAFLGCVVNAATAIEVKAVVADKGYDEIVEGEIYDTTVTFTSEDAFVAGVFNVVVGEGFELDNANVISVIGADGTEVADPSIYQNFTTSQGKVLFQGWDDENLATVVTYKEVVVEITVKATANAEAGAETAITVSNVDITDLDEATCTLSADAVTAGSIHEHNYVEIEDDDASVKTYACSVCGDEKYELVEGESDLSDVTTPNDLASSENGGYAANFKGNGDIAIVYSTKDTANTVYLAELDENDKVIKLSAPKTVSGQEGKVAFDTTYEGGVKSINEPVKAVFVEVNAEGKVVSKSEVVNKSVADYCYYLLENSEKDTEKAYAAALLDYATATQVYFDYNTDKPINGGELKGKYDALTEANNKFERIEEPTTWKFNGGNVTFTTKPTVRLYFSTVGETKVEDLELYLNYKDNKDVEVPADKIGQTTIGEYEFYYIDITDIPTKSLSDTITLTANDEYGTYSVDTYAYNKQGTASGDAARYLVAYSAALAEAFPG